MVNASRPSGVPRNTVPRGVPAKNDATAGQSQDDQATPTPTQWDMYAHTLPNGSYLHVTTSERRTRLYSTRIPTVPVTVTIDPDGPYTGWIPTGATTPIQIQRSHIFDVQFISGHQVEQDAGKGVAVPLTITPRIPGVTP